MDTANKVVDIPPGQIELSPEVAGSSTRHYIKGLGKVTEDVKILLDVVKLGRREETGPMKSLADFAREQGIRPAAGGAA